MNSADLGPKLESFVAKLVESGRCNSKSEALREGNRLIQEREMVLAVLDHALAHSIDDEEAEQAKPLADIVARLRRKYDGAGRPTE